jgi:hypothetical protein
MNYILAFVGYLLPFSMIYSIPWGILVAVLLVFGKLSSDNELVALRANGIGIPRICLPIFIITASLLTFCLWINLYAAPISQVRLRATVFNLASQDPLALFGSDEVIDQFPNRKIYVGRKNGSTLEDLHIYELNLQKVPIRVVYARRGTIEVDKEHERILLHIYDARYEERDPAAVDDLKRMRYGISMREGVLPISLEELLENSRDSTGDYRTAAGNVDWDRDEHCRGLYVFHFHRHYRQREKQSELASRNSYLVAERCLPNNGWDLVLSLGGEVRHCSSECVGPLLLCWPNGPASSSGCALNGRLLLCQAVKCA